jgi:predicted nucleotidyltransferase
LKLSNNQDLTLYEIGKFTKLALESNPNILDIIFSDKEAIFYETKKGKKLRKKGSKIFMSLKTKFTFSGYALSQLNRIRGTIQFSDKTLRILFKALLAGDIDDQWLKDNFKGLHEKKLIHNHSKLPALQNNLEEEE